MDRKIDGVSVVPQCRCGRGKMMLLCAGKGAIHAGRYFYKCPKNVKYPHSFIWCDEYHKDDPVEKIPEYVFKQVYTKKPKITSFHSSTRIARDIAAESEIRSTRLRSDLEV